MIKHATLDLSSHKYQEVGRGMPNINSNMDSNFHQRSTSLHGIFSSKYVIGRGSPFKQPVDWPELMKDTSIASFSMRSRDRRVQRTLNNITDSEVKLRA